MDAHEVVCKLKEMAIDLGRTPIRDEFTAVCSTSKITKLFGTYAALVQAAGLDPVQARRKVDNTIFERSIEKVVQEYEPKQKAEKKIYEPTLFIGDTHFPFTNLKILESIYRFAEKTKPKRIIQVGDLYDLYAHSKFPRSQNIYSPQDEERLGVKMAAEMWSELQKASPGAECVQIKGNHDIRPVKRTLESLSSLEHIVEKHLNHIMTFEGVTLIEDHREEYVFEDVMVHHGYRTKLGDHRDFALMNAVVGHTHRGGVSYRRIRGETMWELNVGFVGELESKVFAYRPQKITTETTGFGFLDEYGPRFIHEG